MKGIKVDLYRTMHNEKQKSMSYLPLLLEIVGRKCVVVGGGKVALRKVKTLLHYEAEIVVVAPEVTSELKRLATQREIKLKRRKIKKTDLKNVALVFSATNDEKINSAVAVWAQEMGIPVNVVDAPELCTFIMPAILRRGALQVAVSTGGEFPGLAQKIRDKLGKIIPRNYASFLRVLAKYRRLIINSNLREKTKRRFILSLRDEELYRVFQKKGKRATEKLLRSWLGLR